MLGLSHRPYQCRWFFGREHLGDALKLRARHTADAFDLLRIPFVHFLSEIVKAIHALLDELLVFPLVRHLGRSEPVDGIATRLLATLEQLVADLVDRRIPRHARPLPIYELHRITQPPITVHEFAHGSSLRAMRAAIDRRFPARLLS